MIAYSKLRLVSKKSRSIDFSDLLIGNTLPSDQTPKAHHHTPPPASPDHGRRSTAALEEIGTIHEDEYPDVTRNSTDRGGGMPLCNNTSSVSAATLSHNKFRLERQRSVTSATPTRGGIRSAVKRAFSSSSSSSLSHDKYCRIHDQCVAILLETSFDDDDDDETRQEDDDDHNSNIPATKPERSMEKEKHGRSRGKILRACKRLLGIHKS